MAAQATIAERIAYGRPVEATEDLQIRVVDRPATALIGRIAISVIFFVSGFAKLVDTPETAAYMASVGIPHPEALAVIAGVAEIFGGGAILFGLLTRIGALGLIVYLIPTTLMFHGFWNFEGEAQRVQLVNFLKNLSIIGGLALLVAYGAGRYSLDARLRRPMQP